MAELPFEIEPTPDGANHPKKDIQVYSGLQNQTMSDRTKKLCPSHGARLTTTDTFLGRFFSEISFVNEFRWVVGAGLEWKFWDHWLLRGEWLHYDFGRTNQFDIVTPVTTGFFTPDNVRTTVDVARAALSYKF